MDILSCRLDATRDKRNPKRLRFGAVFLFEINYLFWFGMKLFILLL